jgi:hypothetical protein
MGEHSAFRGTAQSCSSECVRLSRYGRNPAHSSRSQDERSSKFFCPGAPELKIHCWMGF